jgi:PAS domain S-box-containing protein
MTKATTLRPSDVSPRVGPTTESSRVLTPGLWAGFVVIAVVLIATLFVSLATLRSVFETSESVAHTNAVKAKLEQLLGTLVNAETGERGFVITGQPAYLEPYDQARRTLPSELAQLRALTTDNREHQGDLDRLSAEADRKIRELGEAVRQRQESGFAAAQAAVVDNVGKRIMDEMRVIVARMEAREDALLTTRIAQAEQSYRLARTIRIGTTGLALLVLTALFYSTRRFGTERLRAADNAERLRVTLSSIGDAVIATDEYGRVTRLNPVAEALTGWTEADAIGKRLEEVFVILNEVTRRPAENPIGKALRERMVVGLANHTVLISKDGREIPVDDSAAPIKTAEGQVTGAVMVFRDVTERRRIERERTALVEAERLARDDAEAAERRLRVALEAGRMGTWQWTMVTGELKWSPGLEAIHGYAPGTFPSTFDAFQGEIHPDDRDRTLTAITEAVREGRDHHIEYRIVRGDGTMRWVEGRGQLFFNERGEPDRMVGMCADVTERKQSEERFRLAIEAAPTAMIVVDRHGAITYANALTGPLFGYTPDEIVGESIDRLVPARFRNQHPEYRKGFTADATRRSMGAGRDLYALRKDGSEVPVEIGLSPFETDGGAFTVAAVTDISERKRSEQALIEQARLLDLTHDAIFVRDSSDRIIYWNRGAEELYGWPQDEVLGKVTHDLLRTEFPQPLAEIQATVNRDGQWSGDLLHTRCDGVRLHVASRWALDCDPKGRSPRTILEINNDITTRKRMEAALVERGREAEHANRLKDEFLAMVSHELRTPLSAVLGWADVLRRGAIDDTRHERALTAIHTNARRQVQLIDELLDVSRIISGKLRLERATIDLTDVVRNAVEVVQPLADKKRIGLTLDPESSLSTLYADPGRLQQIVVNLLSNAIKFTPVGGAVDMCVRRVDSLVEMVVTDTGQGIPADFLPLVFEPFRQADESLTRRYGGLGLGLSIVKHLVEAHGGTVAAQSAGEGQGSTFSVRLPTVAVIADSREADTANVESESPSSPPDPGCLDALSVLVVDDDADSRELVAVTLEHYGARVLIAASAEEAFDLVRTDRPDMVLADIAMPDEDGYQLIRRIRALQPAERASIPAAALTSLAREEDRQQALQAGFQLHLAKPIGSWALVRAVVNLTQKVQAQ